MVQLNWGDIGVWEFLSCFQGLGGVVKVHPSDFVVNELRGSDGSVVDLSVDPPDSHPPDDSAFVKFVLHKVTHRHSVSRSFAAVQTKRDTMDVILEVAEELGISPKKFSIAGLKDKWAVWVAQPTIDSSRCRSQVTTQEVTVYGVSVEEVQQIKLRENAVLGSFRLCEKKLHHGVNRGNRFRIVVRGVRGETSGSDVDG